MSTFKPKPYKGHPGWYEIPGFSKYAANRKGFVLNKKLENSTQGGISGRYRKISVYADGEDKPKLRYTHDLICRAFHGKPKKGQVVIHDDNDRLNIAASNLKWGTQSQNIQDMWDDGLREGKEGYQEEDNSTFTHDGEEYQLNPILEKAHRSKPVILPIKDLAWNIKGARYDEHRVSEADYKFPIVVLDTVKWGYVVIDGTHRLIKAHRDSKKTITAYILKENDIEPHVLSVESLNNLTEVPSKHTVKAKHVGELFHLSFSGTKAGTWSPITPAGTEDANPDDLEFGEPPVPRISLSPTLEQCFRAIYPNIDFYFKNKRYPHVDIYAYRPRFKGVERVVLPQTLTQERWVWDAHVTDEHWVLDKLEMELVGRYRFFNTEDNTHGYATRPFDDPNEPPNSYVGPNKVEFIPLKDSPALENMPPSANW